jgi:hypothetical protein
MTPMEWRTIISPQLSAALGTCGLSRDALILTLSALHQTLPEEAERWRRTRAPDEPDSFFLFRLGFTDGDAWHRLAFWVDDVTAPGFLFVERLVHQARPIE